MKLLLLLLWKLMDDGLRCCRLELLLLVDRYHWPHLKQLLAAAIGPCVLVDELLLLTDKGLECDYLEYNLLQ